MASGIGLSRKTLEPLVDLARSPADASTPDDDWRWATPLADEAIYARPAFVTGQSHHLIDRQKQIEKGIAVHVVQSLCKLHDESAQDVKR